MSYAVEDGTEESSPRFETIERTNTTESGTPNAVHERQPSTSALRVTRNSTLSDPFSIAPELNDTQDTFRQGLRNRIQQSEEQTVQAPPPPPPPPRPTQRERRQNFAPIRLPPLPPTILERTLNFALMILMIVISLLFLRSFFFIKGK